MSSLLLGNSGDSEDSSVSRPSITFGVPVIVLFPNMLGIQVIYAVVVIDVKMTVFRGRVLHHLPRWQIDVSLLDFLQVGDQLGEGVAIDDETFDTLSLVSYDVSCANLERGRWG